MKNNKKKLLKIGSYSIGLSAAVLAIVIVFNLFIGQLPGSWVKPDTTTDAVLTFGDETKKLLAGVDEEITLYHVVREGSEDPYLTELLERYANENPKIKVKTVDPVKKPTFTSDYTTAAVSDNTVIAVSEKRHIVIDGSSFNMYEPVEAEGMMLTSEEYLQYKDYYEQQGYSFNVTPYFCGEKELSGAVDYVSADSLPILYTLGGHSETALAEAYKTFVGDENVEIKELTLVAGESVAAPEDAAAILINAPQSDIADSELDALKSYLDAGGDIILITDYNTVVKTQVPNIAALAEYMGLEAVGDLIIEQDTQHYYPQPDYLIPNITSAGAGALLDSSNIAMMMADSHGIKSTGDDNREVAPLLETSESAYLYSDEEQKTSTFSVAYQSKTLDESGAVTDSSGTLVWFASPYILGEQFMQSARYGFSNDLYFAALLQQMCEKTTSINVIAKALTGATITVNAFDSMLWHIVYIGLIPALVLGVGFTVWFRRRRR